MRIISVIPAKGDSKGLPGKNVMKILDKPLLAWSIEHALNTKLINEVYVSSDSVTILDIARDYGAKGILRPAEYARDDSPSEDALLHVLSKIEDGTPVDYVVFLQPTSPIRAEDDIEKAIKKIIEEGADSLLSVTPIKDHFKWRKNKTGEMEPINYDFKNRRPRQQIEELYLENGSFYITKTDVLKKERNRLGGKIAIYEMPKGQSFQIDDGEDFEACEYLLTKMYERENAKQ